MTAIELAGNKYGGYGEMIPEGVDGIDHINVYSKGKTALGRWLTNFAYSPITIPEFGDFASIESYWYFLGCEDDNLRHLHGFAAKKTGKAIPKTIDRPNFNELICKAIDIKIKYGHALRTTRLHPTFSSLLRVWREACRRRL
jgi:hypothetical protein